MKNDNDLVFGFKLTEIKTEEFAVIDEAYKETKKVNLDTSIEFGIDPESQAIGIKIKFQFEQRNKPFIVIATTCVFNIDDNAWKKLFKKDDNILVLPQGFASHLAVITVGTIRGILHEKTKGSIYNKFILPPINLTDLIKEDVQIDLKNLDAPEID